MANITMPATSVEDMWVESWLDTRFAASSTKHTLRSTHRGIAIRIFESGRDSVTSARVHPAMERLSKSLIWTDGHWWRYTPAVSATVFLRKMRGSDIFHRPEKCLETGHPPISFSNLRTNLEKVKYGLIFFFLLEISSSLRNFLRPRYDQK